MRYTTFAVLVPLVFAAQAFAADAPAGGTGKVPMHRYMIERTFPAGALEGLNTQAKKKINATNAEHHVRWVMSYANAEKTRTFCVYEAPSEAAVRDAAKANNIPVDSVTEVPVTLTPR
ncbi:MAG: DUF4242 domain-containing protein [Proteobacteria bacterium]|nr:DUF4242 domain-containing protein [Pseudomonadota bacterium]